MAQSQKAPRERTGTEPRDAPQPKFRRVVPLGYFGNWNYYRALGGQVMAIWHSCHEPRGISLLACGWIEVFRECWPLFDRRGQVIGWDPVLARFALLHGCQLQGEFAPHKLPEWVSHSYPIGRELTTGGLPPIRGDFRSDGSPFQQPGKAA